MEGREGATHSIFAAKGAVRRSSALLRKLAAFGLFAAALVAPETVRAEPDPYAPKWHPWVELGGLGSDGDSRGVIEFWSPLMQSSNALFFFDGKFQFIEDDAQEGNAQFGVRKMTPSGWNLGAWLSGDLRETSLDNNFWQVAGGLEALSVKWDLRLNGYLPVTDPQVSPSTAEVVLKRNNIFMIGGEEVALYGVDGEIGYLLFGSPETKPGTRHEFRVYGGGFWFDHSDAIHEVAGPSARVEWRIDDLIPDWGGSRLTFDAGYSHDQVRDDIWQVGARLRIPLGGTKTYALLSPQARRMQERIERDDDIVTVQSGPEKVRDTLTGVRFDRVAYVNSSITGTSNAAGDNSLLIVNGTVSGPQQLQGNQTLQGGKSTILVTGTKSGVTKSFTASGAKAHLIDPGDAASLTLLGSNTHIAGLNIIGAGMESDFFDNHGIFGGDGKSNIFIEQTYVVDAGGSGIYFGSNNNDVTIANTTVARAGEYGIRFEDDNRNITIAHATVTEIDNNHNISFGNRNRDITIAHTSVIDNFHEDGINFENDNRNITIVHTTVSGTQDHGIVFEDGNRNITIANTTITNVDDDGIRFRDGNENVTISGATITDSGNDGIHIENDNRNVRIADTSITGAVDDGIEVGALNTVTIVRTHISDVGFGIFWEGTFSTVTIADSSITDVSNDGLLISGGFNTIAMNRTVFAGDIGTAVEISFESNTLSGANNSAADANYTTFCDALPQANGSFFAFDDIGTGTGSPGGPGTCPVTP